MKRCDYGAFHQGRIAQLTFLPPLFGQHFESQFGRHDSAAQVHQQEYSIFTPDLFNGGKYFESVRAKCLTVIREASSLPYLDLTSSHLHRQFMDAPGKCGTVGDDHQTDQN